MKKILVCKNLSSIAISQDGKRLVIDKNNKLFYQLKDLSKEEIINWYKNR